MDSRKQLRILALVWSALIAIGLRFEVPYFRPFELIRTEGPVFLPNRQIEMEAYGALSFRLVAPEIRHPRPNVFTTDDAGFRNPPMAPPPVVVIGDSFVVGVGLSDHETFPRALSRELGLPVYNYGAQGAEGPPYFLADRRFGRAGELIVYMPSESAIVPIRMPGGRAQPPAKDGPTRLRVPATFAGLERLGQQLLQLNLVVNRDNGLTQVARLYYQRANRALLGNPNQIVADGAPALVLTLDEQKRTQPLTDEALAELVDSYLRFKAIADRRQARFVIAPIPESGTIYEDLFPEAQRARAVHPGLLERLNAQLVEAGVEVIDLVPLFRAHRSPYLYLRDDNHWDTHAVELTARHVASELRRRGLVAATSSAAPAP